MLYEGNSSKTATSHTFLCLIINNPNLNPSPYNYNLQTASRPFKNGGQMQNHFSPLSVRIKTALSNLVRLVEKRQSRNAPITSQNTYKHFANPIWPPCWLKCKTATKQNIFVFRAETHLKMIDL